MFDFSRPTLRRYCWQMCSCHGPVRITPKTSSSGSRWTDRAGPTRTLHYDVGKEQLRQGHLKGAGVLDLHSVNWVGLDWVDRTALRIPFWLILFTQKTTIDPKVGHSQIIILICWWLVISYSKVIAKITQVGEIDDKAGETARKERHCKKGS